MLPRGVRGEVNAFCIPGFSAHQGFGRVAADEGLGTEQRPDELGLLLEARAASVIVERQRKFGISDDQPRRRRRLLGGRAVGVEERVEGGDGD